MKRSNFLATIAAIFLAPFVKAKPKFDGVPGSELIFEKGAFKMSAPIEWSPTDFVWGVNRTDDGVFITRWVDGKEIIDYQSFR